MDLLHAADTAIAEAGREAAFIADRPTSSSEPRVGVSNTAGAVMDSGINQRVVEKFCDQFSRGDYEAALSMLDESATWWVAGSTPISGLYEKVEFARLLEGISAAMHGPITIRPIAFTVQGSRVAVEAESDAMTRTGRAYRNQYHFLFIVRDGRIQAVKEYLDTEHARAVLCSI